MYRFFAAACTVALLFTSVDSHAQSVSVTDGRVVLENDVIRYVVSAPSEPASIDAISFFDLRTNAELLSSDESVSLFELSLNNRLVSSSDPVWRFDAERSRVMANGGREIVARYRAEAGAARGAIVELTFQVFPGSELVRQRIAVSSVAGSPVAMTYHNDGPHVVFPRLTVRAEQSPMQTRETRVATWNAEMVDADAAQFSYDERSEEEGWREGRNLAHNYMYHPVTTTRRLSPHGSISVKGPMLYTRVAPNTTWIALYEHGSPDDDPDQDYIRLEATSSGTQATIGVRTRSGAYFSGDVFSQDNPFESVWTAVGPSVSGNADSADAAIWEYLLTHITEHAASREPIIYYNTWGMQREERDRGRDPREVLTMQRVLEDVDYAAQLGIDQFVLDDGWQNTFGDWLPHPDRYPDGLAPLRAKLEEMGIVFGIWIATLANDADSEIAVQRPEWLIRDADGRPEIGNWDRQVFCFVSDYRDYYIDVSKRLIDEGGRYFKWDGIDKHLCDSPHHHHGDERHTPHERRQRYGYLLSRYLTEVARELHEYHPDVVVEFDVTEPERSVGLEFLSEGRYFWINNGASWYGDTSHYRARSMRLVPSLYHSFLPPVLQTAANYPHNHPEYMAQRYAVNTSLLGGFGFWGDLSTMTEEERLRVGAYVEAFNPVKETVARVRPKVEGLVGSSPEIYSYYDREAAEGQVVAFSSTPGRRTHVVDDIDAARILGVVRNAYDVGDDGLAIHFVFPHGEASREAYIRSNEGSGIRVARSTSWLEALEVSGSRLEFVAGAPGRHDVLWPAALGAPQVEAAEGVCHEVEDAGDGLTLIRVETGVPGSRVVISGR